MSRVLFVDVDGAPFTAFEMLAVLRDGHEIVWAGSRRIPERLKSGELAPLGERELRVSGWGRDAAAAAAVLLAGRPWKLLSTLAIAFAGHLREPGAFGKLLASLGWTLALARFAEGRRVDHLHASWAHLPATSAWIVSRLTGIPFSFSAHAGRDLHRITALLPRKVADASFAVACNRAAWDRLIELSGAEAARKVRLCYHGVDLERFRPGAEPEGGFLLSVGNLEPAKGLDVAIRALGELRHRGRAIRYRIVGEGEERGRLAALADRLGVAAEVEFCGRLEGEALVEAYRHASALVAPSRVLHGGGRDGLPNVVLEAMAAGVPVVASNVAAIPEAVEHERSGLLVPPEDVGALAQAIARMLDDRELRSRVTRSAREKAIREFDRSKNVSRFCSLFSGEFPAGGREVSSAVSRSRTASSAPRDRRPS